MSDDDHRFSEPGPDPEGINLMTIKAHIELPSTKSRGCKRS